VAARLRSYQLPCDAILQRSVASCHEGLSVRVRAVPLGELRAVLWHADLPAIFAWPRPGCRPLILAPGTAVRGDNAIAVIST